MNVLSYSIETEAPWERWEVDNDREFLQTLQKWNASKPESSLDQVMKKVQEKLNQVADLAESETVKVVMELIPNNPFPAGTLVKGLVSVMVIGVVGSL
jgi:hydroxypyruvate isomerase